MYAVVDKSEPTKNKSKDEAETSGERGDKNGINFIAFGTIHQPPSFSFLCLS